MFKALVVYGTRPEAIKLAPMIRALAEHPDVHPVVVTTGQHPDMVTQIHRDYGIRPDHDLAVFREGQSLDQLMARILFDLGPLIAAEAPDVVVVQGDTTSCCAGALAALHAQVPLVHLEAGMRSGNKMAPYPEESYRRLIAQICDLHLAASPANRENLLREGIADDDILVVGSTAIDSLLEMLSTPVDLTDFRHIIDRPGRLVVVTCHRRESWGPPMVGIGRALANVARKHPSDTFLVSAHPNKIVRDALLPQIRDVDNIEIAEPVAYRQFAALMQRAHVLVTDSGGIQAEAPSLKVPTLVLRETTEYGETVRAGTARLVGSDQRAVERELTLLLDDDQAHDAMRLGYSPYGDGRAGERSAQALVNLLRTGSHQLEPVVPAEGDGIVPEAT
ncbi:non-hydrolyzing UDP-N-acetylglucosamine 2-epimerase [Nocardioides sp. cx-173]|uniref:non-hydrolyzing UDP-N-acetylglucosamine 2-epimerase n=1 Tax=Nocardioides sp. cx-173 TaxID=2898796 RepID=UPI001E53D7B4|nr:UDP-N-acetylglucosamine 2-epimerase (non-hydrolyzing) [Nocardioides sp. cx-173]MCD4523768.1 UDP-N-acetylglucosamine 2-epimerase (non-hydrolyzing) [Nocardioides sp. cx-173]UGB41908.1 UDP-N-acetylglucosamine 2-epimerase (non-hydrolyzing) [Nocardioides sp. cx-173]